MILGIVETDCREFQLYQSSLMRMRVLNATPRNSPFRYSGNKTSNTRHSAEAD
jgi:hypothetical protein